ncbi:S-layer homology domain-containing protein [Carboxydocella sp. JDF658]|uniref:S-layer homology domain-containing protein n=1 Tax=Carboxydocella sp. JDF658 TaxID=1926600 RepID=UPI0009AC7EE5|nr:S-layer homology domain-containing protein [Carboxydocella sp. JDF658]GAW31272.1 hypothetical protein JDF658_10370 [Carboxydocella sp. JDF658]
MKNSAKFWLGAVMLLVLLLGGANGAGAAEPWWYYEQLPLEPVVAIYTAPDGKEIVSLSSAWSDPGKLQALYYELKNNVHGKEWDYLGGVVIYPDYPLGRGVGGLYVPELGWDSRGQRYVTPKRPIFLFGGDEQTELADVAKTMAHEYGHHFTVYYFWTKYGVTFDNYWRTPWYDIRQGIRDPRVNNGSHAWDPAEIAADDYAQLFGSPQARQFTKFTSQFGYFSSSSYNLSPQENLALPLAAQVPGLEAYWRQLAGLPAATNQPPKPPQLALTGSGQDERGHYLTFSWSQAVDDRYPASLEYTLVYHGPNDTLAAPVAYTFGDNREARFYLGRETGSYYFRVFARDASGYVVSSPILAINLSNLPAPTAVPRGWLFWDIGPDYWGYLQVEKVTARKILVPNAYNNFVPWGNITRAQLAVFLQRAFPQAPATQTPPVFKDTSNHSYAWYINWAASRGWLKGTPQGYFYPDRLVTRAELAAVLARLPGVEQLPVAQSGGLFPDTTNHWARDIIRDDVRRGLMYGNQHGYFNPDRATTRIEFSVALSKLL